MHATEHKRETLNIRIKPEIQFAMVATSMTQA